VDEIFQEELQMASDAGEKEEETSRQRRKKMKNLPTFASVEDYAEMLDDDEDEDL